MDKLRKIRLVGVGVGTVSLAYICAFAAQMLGYAHLSVGIFLIGCCVFGGIGGLVVSKFMK